MKKPFIYLLTAGLAFSMIANTEKVEGAEQSEASVTFTVPEVTVVPVDPENPENPNTEIDPSDGNNTNQVGPLSLDYISNISFGEHDISYSSEDLVDGNLILNSITQKPYVQVTDNRGYGEGWNLTAAATNFTSQNEDDETVPTLPAATINFTGGTTISDVNESIASPDITPTFSLSTDGNPVEVAVAESRDELGQPSGLGTWVMRWLNDGSAEDPVENNKVTLVIPSIDVTEGLHTATIDWTLTNAPQGGIELQ